MTIEVLDPAWEGGSETGFQKARRLDALDGLTLGVVSNGKRGTQPFFAALAKELEERFGAAEVQLLTKANYSAPAEAAVFDGAREWNALISGIGD